MTWAFVIESNFLNSKKYLVKILKDIGFTEGITLATKKDQIKDIPADNIVCLGKDFTKIVIGKAQPVKSVRTRVYEKWHKKIYFSYSLLSIDKNPYMYDAIKDDINWAINRHTWLTHVPTPMWHHKCPNKQHTGVKVFDLETNNTLNAFHHKSAITRYTMMCCGHLLAGEDNRYGLYEQRLIDTLEGQAIIAYNGKFDVVWAFRNSNRKNGRVFKDTTIIDPQVMASLLNENKPDNSLKHNSAYYTTLGHYEESFPNNIKTGAEYNALDVVATNVVSDIFYPKIREAEQDTLFWFISRTQSVLADMELYGVEVDRNKLSNLTSKYSKIKNESAWELKKAYGEMNFNSHPQLSELLYSKLKLVPKYLTKKGNPSTSRRALKAMGDIAVVKNLLDYKGASKMLEAFLLPMKEYIMYDGRIHCTYNVCKTEKKGTATGRLSCSNPNLQQIPRLKEIKSLFYSKNGMIEADYTQVELCVAAWLAHESVWLDAFAEGKDIHTEALAKLTGKSYTFLQDMKHHTTHPDFEYWDHMRVAIKKVNFGVLYGIGANKLRLSLLDYGIDMPLEDCQKIISEWKKVHRGIMRYIHLTQEMAKTLGYVESYTKRRRHMPSYVDWDSWQGKRLLRQACNFPVQSLASDVTMSAMQYLYDNAAHVVRPLVTVHDSVIMEKVKSEKYYETFNIELDHLQKMMTVKTKEHLEQLFGGDIMNLPLVVDIKQGKSWGEMA